MNGGRAQRNHPDEWNEMNNQASSRRIYRVDQKTKLLTFVYVFAKYWPTVKIRSLARFVENV